MKYEYKVMNFKDIENEYGRQVSGHEEVKKMKETVFNRLGDQGWELVAVYDSSPSFYFKREK